MAHGDGEVGVDQFCRLLCGDSRLVLPTLAAGSIDAVCTDPPYELGFMGRTWDKSGIAYSVDLWRELLRVMKPGGHMLAFGGTRTYHRMVCAIEDAGWEIRDCMVHWTYGTGFPKSLDISKALDKVAGAQREVISEWRTGFAGTLGGYGGLDHADVRTISAPATPQAAAWQGWGTALKPSHEPICLARKPFTGTVASNVLRHGTGALNIDGCRLESSGFKWGEGGDNDLGRWPANTVFTCCGEEPHRDGCPVGVLDEQAGERSSGVRIPGVLRANRGGFNGPMPVEASDVCYGDTGPASRFFYVSKPSRVDRGQRWVGHYTAPQK